MITDFNQLDLTKKYTYADYLTWHFKERVELIKGWILKMSPAPSSRHQRLSLEFATEINNYLRKSSCKVFAAPFDVRLYKSEIDNNAITTVVQPDICIICDNKKIDAKGCIGAPDMIIEILSLGNSKRDIDTKYKLYESNGVQEYWIVYPNDEVLHVFDLVGENYVQRGVYFKEDIVDVKVVDGLSIDMKNIFETIEE
jgi:Uma2 family endonuclease